MKKIIKLIRFIFDILLPPRCLICGEIVYKENGLCAKCFSKINFLSNQSCPICGRPYTFPIEDGNTLICGKCLSKPPVLRGLKAVFAYDDFSKNLILPFKHADRTDLVPYLSKLMFKRGKEFFEEADCIIPVPLHWKRKLKRKYNQAALLALNIEKLSQKPCLLSVLSRHRYLTSQKNKTRKERLENIKNAFKVKDANLIKNKKIVLIDDVYTTGATLNECARVLYKAGAKDVVAVVIARVCYFE
ncbi:MAG: ComF family protein [Alphaproteobacteria bacterium]|nr:ComF family protein [Alphaproteobacteria bacterium]